MSGCSLGSGTLFAVSASNTALLTFLLYTIAVFGIAAVSNRLMRGKNFLSEYFLGSRSLGMWAFALTFAATSSSGGSFTGFPSKIYTHGWILGLWIGSYTVVPICAMGLLGKRLNHVARISGAITVPDVLRDRMHSALFGLLATVLIVFFMSFNLVAQFKAGGEILNTLLSDVPLFSTAAGWLSGAKSRVDFLRDVNSTYLLCLIAFAISVIVYTTYGGFHAVVWTDVMQGVVMVVGVVIMLPLAIWEVGGLSNATRQMADMTPPRLGFAEFRLQTPLAASQAIPSPWFSLPSDDGVRPRLFRVSRSLAIPAGKTIISNVKVVEITTPEEIDQQLARLRDPDEIKRLGQRVGILKGLQIRWLFQQLEKVPFEESQAIDLRMRQLESESDRTSGVDAALLNAPEWGVVEVTISLLQDYKYGHDQPGVYVTGPGPDPPQLPRTAAEAKEDKGDKVPPSNGFLPLSLAISFFFMWAISGAGQPSSMVRLMAFNNTRTLRRAIFTVAIYYSLIYFPLVVIFCCARVMLPGMDLESDRIMPQMAVTLTNNIGHGWLAGLLIAAPFAAVMSTVDSFLLMTSSALVRDIYQRNINPEASQRTIKRLSYLCTLAVGAGAMLGAIKPPMFLQDIIVYTGSGLAACFLGPMVFALYWPRANAAGCIAGMLAGFLTHLSMYVGGIFAHGSFYKPYQIFNFDPIIVGLFVSFATVYVVSKLTPPPPDDLVRKYFYRQKPSTAKN